MLLLCRLSAFAFLNEPLSSLNGKSRGWLGRDLRAILQDTGQTALLVTHSLTEARLMADEIGSIRAGQFHVDF